MVNSPADRGQETKKLVSDVDGTTIKDEFSNGSSVRVAVFCGMQFLKILPLRGRVKLLMTLLSEKVLLELIW